MAIRSPNPSIRTLKCIPLPKFCITVPRALTDSVALTVGPPIPPAASDFTNLGPSFTDIVYEP